jgi:hypothetical protein
MPLDDDCSATKDSYGHFYCVPNGGTDCGAPCFKVCDAGKYCGTLDANNNVKCVSDSMTEEGCLKVEVLCANDDDPQLHECCAANSTCGVNSEGQAYCVPAGAKDCGEIACAGDQTCSTTQNLWKNYYCVDADKLDCRDGMTCDINETCFAQKNKYEDTYCVRANHTDCGAPSYEQCALGTYCGTPDANNNNYVQCIDNDEAGNGCQKTELFCAHKDSKFGECCAADATCGADLDGHAYCVPKGGKDCGKPGYKACNATEYCSTPDDGDTYVCCIPSGLDQCGGSWCEAGGRCKDGFVCLVSVSAAASSTYSFLTVAAGLLLSVVWA